MSVKKSKLDLLVRVRYQNPLPPPPCPPKLINIPTDPKRYTKLSFTNELANETPLPMIIDGDCGMPIDLTQWESLWNEKGDDSDLNPRPDTIPPVDPKDAWMLSESLAHPPNGHGGSLSNNIHVPWLRKTEYISRETIRHGQNHDLKITHEAPVDISHEAQVRNIEASFKSVTESFDLSNLKYPGKSHLKAVDSWSIFPDQDIWANAYDLFKFSERPGDRPIEKDDPRLDCAVLRPMESDGEHFLAYYLLKDDDSIDDLNAQRSAVPLEPIVDEEAQPHTIFQFVRDYETVKIEQDVSNEYLLVFHNENGEIKDEPGSKSSKAAYYKNIERKINLKKKRLNKHETIAYTDKWDAIQLSHVPFSQEELDERNEAIQEVVDPLYLLRGDPEEGNEDGDVEIKDDEVKEEVKEEIKDERQNGDVVDTIMDD